ncbi:PLP-dependent aminotransferase family protein [Clostridium formicaceticum]|uniref:2-aminoadipate transaminase n=1 Tax=Clostridium formicaceticum TaxID=1497 RepID=A0AAC9RME0_9CLOT|nr:PLP-dependent aminotransferase family protein [Clostridium formicaceticum]AOY77695.1 GntR family transcriptional regulator [Clostridium formicaceticum]ARE88282.1 2-aminoadipate transaminase [Clostridium formicaceticum]
MDISKLMVNTKLDSTSPYYLQIAALIRTKIIDHSMTIGEKLPAERELALLFKVSRTTAINAYRHLEKDGYVNIKNGSGTYVSDRYALENKTSNEIPWPQLLKPHIQPSMASLMSELMVSSFVEDKISLDAGMPDPSYYPIDIFSKLHRDYLGELAPRDFGHIPVQGYEPLRHTIAQMLNLEGIKCHSNEVIILSGSQQGLYLTAKVLVEPGDYVIVQTPTYLGAIQVFQALGARVLSLPQREDFSFEILEDYLARYRPKLLYCIPTFRNPNGAVINTEERKKLIQLAARYRLAILEDDPYSKYYYEDPPPMSLKSFDNYGGVVYLSTFSKTLMPGLRLGYMVAHPSLISRIILEKQYIDLHSNNISQWLLDLFIKEGYLEKHLIKMRGVYKNRRNVMADALNLGLKSKISFNIPKGGFYIWCRIIDNISSRKLLQETLKMGVSFVPGEAFYAVAGEDKDFRLCFSQHNEKVILEGISRLEKAIEKFKKGQLSIPKREVRPII